MWEYTGKVKDHFLNPRNVGVVENADGIGEVGSLACGDALKLSFKLGPDNKIEDVKFQTFGCASAIASSSVLTEMLKGMTLEEAEKVSNEDIAEALGGLPREKMHCSVMGRDALEKAISNFRGQEAKKADGQIVCDCFGVTDKEIHRVVKEHNLSSIEEVTNYVKAGGGCQKCHADIQEILDSYKGDVKPKPAPLTNIRKIQLIQETLEREVRPTLKQDGGDIELVDVDGDKVLVRLQGRCSSCQASQATLKDHVEAKLRELVVDTLVVEEV
ncbi:NifU-like protein [Desulfatibacillum alkenivorans DSM 16219]|jgi:NifU-like protein|uniref:Nitrogen fixation protein NifU n=1 Tax=Desulfatibacillum alkenivorans DSM 16219 TaxID=1121393 RepID=A0A1M6L631_9BACT|nr:NifU-like protein [Desulfatibacillum alkenivorans DSM 16219]